MSHSSKKKNRANLQDQTLPFQHQSQLDSEMPRGISGWWGKLMSGRRRSAFDIDAQAALDRVIGGADTNISSRTRIGTRNINVPDTMTREGWSLADLKAGECGYISHLAGSAQNRLRLLEMGMTPGTHVQVLRTAAFGGPLDVNVRGYQLSLRREEATAVWLGNVPTERNSPSDQE